MPTFAGIELVNGSLPSSILSPIPGGRLRLDAAESWLRFVAELATMGVHIEPTSPVDTFRPRSVQERIFYERYEPRASGSGPFGDVRWYRGTRFVRVRGAAAAEPGTSNHGWGLAVDVKNMGGFTSAKYKAVVRVGATHGWDNKEGAKIGEAWHIVYDPANDQHRGAAPVDEEDDMPLDKQDLENISEAVWWGGVRSQVSRTVDGQAVKVPALQELADTNTRLLKLLERVDPDELRKVIWVDTVVQREVAGQVAQVPVLQEIADAKSNAVDANIHAAKTREMVARLPAGTSVEIDTAVLADKIVERLGKSLSAELAADIARRLAQ